LGSGWLFWVVAQLARNRHSNSIKNREVTKAPIMLLWLAIMGFVGAGSSKKPQIAECESIGQLTQLTD
jgi:hypothetical protein